MTRENEYMENACRSCLPNKRQFIFSLRLFLLPSSNTQDNVLQKLHKKKLTSLHLPSELYSAGCKIKPKFSKDLFPKRNAIKKEKKEMDRGKK